MKLATKYKKLLEQHYVCTPLRLAHFFAQIHHESNLRPQSENLYYTTIKAARRAFYTPFKNKTDAFVGSYLRNPKKMANYVYANRMGNGGFESGDGWRFRGRGFMMNTGKNQYTLLSKDTRIDYLNNPDLLLNEADSMIAALWYWRKNNLNKYADIDDLDSVSDLINKGKLTKAYGDANNFKHRKELLEKYKLEFNQP